MRWDNPKTRPWSLLQDRYLAMVIGSNENAVQMMEYWIYETQQVCMLFVNKLTKTAVRSFRFTFYQTNNQYKNGFNGKILLKKKQVCLCLVLIIVLLTKIHLRCFFL